MIRDAVKIPHVITQEIIQLCTENFDAICTSRHVRLACFMIPRLRTCISNLTLKCFRSPGHKINLEPTLRSGAAKNTSLLVDTTVDDTLVDLRLLVTRVDDITGTSWLLQQTKVELALATEIVASRRTNRLESLLLLGVESLDLVLAEIKLESKVVPASGERGLVQNLGRAALEVTEQTEVLGLRLLRRSSVQNGAGLQHNLVGAVVRRLNEDELVLVAVVQRLGGIELHGKVQCLGAGEEAC